MTEPTEAEKREFWEWCGFVQEEVQERDYTMTHFRAPDGKIWYNCLPPIDLNNLFEYAWDLAVERLAEQEQVDSYQAKWSLIIRWVELWDDLWDIIKDPAQALCQVLEQVRKEAKNDLLVKTSMD